MAKILATVLLGAVGAAALAADQASYEGGDNYAIPRPYTMALVRSATITANGAWSDAISGDETAETCSRFLLTQADVREYFRRARRVSYKEYGQDLDMSRCSAAGDLVLANGDRGTWKVDLARRGVISLTDGRNLHFHCPKCRAKVFD
jgi:hypothetical protein